MKDLFVKYKELIMYIIVGVMTVAINLTSYMTLTRLFNFEEMLANTSAWAIALIFSFIMNKLFVFESKSMEIKTVSKEFTIFTAGRFSTLLLDELITFLGIKVFAFNDLLVQLVKHTIIIILNYILSKISFKKK